MKLFLTFLYLICVNFEIFASQTFERSLQSFNISKKEISNFDQYQHAVVLKAKNLSESEDELKLKFYIAETNQILLLTKALNGETTIENTNQSFEFELKTFDGRIQDNLFDTILNDTGSEDLARVIANAFDAEFKNTKRLRANAFYQFSVETITEDNGESEFGMIDNAKIIVGKATVEKESIYDLDSQGSTLITKEPAKEERIFVTPVVNHRVSSLFNLHRKHPITRRIQPHNGIDFAARSGTPIFPALEGRVIAIARARSKGKFVVIDHGNGFQSSYDHMKKFKKGLRVGDYVSTKDQIGEVGRTGYATGNHLHFTILKDGFFVNPLLYFKNIELDSAAEAEDNKETLQTAPASEKIQIEPIWLPTNHSFLDLEHLA